jgi:hypothetical protein
VCLVRVCLDRLVVYLLKVWLVMVSLVVYLVKVWLVRATW